MGKKTIITIAGDLGSGKSSTARLIAEKLGFDHFSSGDLMRAIATKHGMTIEELNSHAEEHAKVDHEIDDEVRKAGLGKQLVIDSRTAFHWIPNSFKVMLRIIPSKAAERIWNSMQKHGRVSQNANNVEQVLTNTLTRAESEKKRFLSLYNLDITDESQFDLVIRTEDCTLEDVVQKVIEEYTKWAQSESM